MKIVDVKGKKYRLHEPTQTTLKWLFWAQGKLVSSHYEKQLFSASPPCIFRESFLRKKSTRYLAHKVVLESREAFKCLKEGGTAASKL